MPIYEYKCELCGQIFEKLIISSEDENHITCPKCSDRHISRVLSAVGILGTSCARTTSGFS